MYAVIEFTPGYLPDDDDPPIFDQWQEAVNYVRSERQRLFDDDFGYEFSHVDNIDEPQFMLDVGDFDGDGFIYFDTRKIHDLGRIIQIVLVEEE